MRMRLERAERAIEQERATVRELQRALGAARQVNPSLHAQCSITTLYMTWVAWQGRALLKY